MNNSIHNGSLSSSAQSGVALLRRKSANAQKTAASLATKPSSPHFHHWNFFSAFAIDDPAKRDELEGILIAALPTANNGSKPRLKKARALLSSDGTQKTATHVVLKKRKMSAAARKRIGDAPRKRWAKQKASK